MMLKQIRPISRLFQNSFLSKQPYITIAEDRLKSKIPLKHVSILDSDSTINLSDPKKIGQLVKKKKKRLEDEYSINARMRIKHHKQLRKELHHEKQEHHKAFARIKYEPTFPKNGFPPTDLSQCDPKRPGHYSFVWRRRRVGLIGTKVGMMQLFDSNGYARPVTIIKIDNCEVVHLSLERDPRYGTFGIQIGHGYAYLRSKNFSELGHFAKHGVAPKRKLRQFQVHKDALLPVGTELLALHFIPGQFVDIQGTEIGKGFQGVVKRWGFRGGPATHGSSKFHRKRGSFGGCTDPGKVWKGVRMPGREGGGYETHHDLKVFRVDPVQNLLYVIGHVPGYKGNYLRIRDAWFNPPSKPPFPTFFPDPDNPITKVMEMTDDPQKWYYERDANPDSWNDKVPPDLL